MLVLHVIDNMKPGGAQALLMSILHTSVSQGNVRHLVFCLRKHKLHTVRSVDAEDVLFADTTQKLSAKALAQLLIAVRKLRPDILHCHLLGSQIFAFALKWLFSRTTRVVFHQHGQLSGPPGRSVILARLHVLVFQVAQHVADRIIAVSRATEGSLLEAGIPATKILCLLNSIDTRQYTPSRDSESEQATLTKAAPGTFKVGYAARLVPGKGWETLLDAAEYLSRNRGMEFFLAGAGPDHSEVVRRIRQASNPRIRWLGHVDDMTSFYSGVDCVVVPSYREAFGLVALEAQASGKPVIASDVPALNEIVVHRVTGLLFTYGDPGGLAQSIEELQVDHDLRNQIIANALVQARELDIRNYVDRLEGIYRALMVPAS